MKELLDAQKKLQGPGIFRRIFRIFFSFVLKGSYLVKSARPDAN
jgi:hypothetical protein